MVEQGRSADRDTDSVRGKTPLQGGSEKRISPRNITAEHQYVRAETGKDRTRELRQLFAVDVEKTARSRIGERFDTTRPRPLLSGFEPAGNYETIIGRDRKQ